MIRLKKFAAVILSVLIAVQSAFIAEPIETVQAATKMQSLFDETVVVHGNETTGKKPVYGIDVSHYQGNINWTKVRKAGVEFAFIKIGGSSLSNGKFYVDSKFAYNIKAAKAAGVKVGIYYFSQATTTSEAKTEVNNVFKTLGNQSLDLPIIYDAEFGGTTSSKLYQACKKAGGESSAAWKKQWTSIAMAFCSAVEAKGYKAGFYGSVSKVVKKIDYKTIDAKYQMWIARYKYIGSTSPNLLLSGYSYSGSYEYFQYSDHGHVDGISGYVDLDIYYAPSNSTYKGCSYYNKFKIGSGSGLKASVSGNAIKLSWSASDNATQYLVYRSETALGSYKKIATVKGRTYTDNDREKGREYYYYIIPQNVIDGVTRSGTKSSTIRAYCTGTGLGSVKAKAKVVIRKEASGSAKKVITAAKNATLKCLCFTKGTDTKKWYKVRYTKGKKVYTGYVSSTAVAQIKSVKTIKSAVVRKKTSTTSKKMVTVPTNTAVSISYSVTDKKKQVWYQVSYKKGTKTYQGYVLASCLQL